MKNKGKDLLGQIMAFENGEMDRRETGEFFQDMIDNGMAWRFKGSYGKTAQDFITAGLCVRRSSKTNKRITTKEKSEFPSAPIPTAAQMKEGLSRFSRSHGQSIPESEQQTLLEQSTYETIKQIQSEVKAGSRKSFLKAAQRIYKSSPLWPVDQRGRKLGEKQALDAGKAYLALQAMCNDRFHEDMSEMTVEEVQEARKQRRTDETER